MLPLMLQGYISLQQEEAAGPLRCAATMETERGGSAAAGIYVAAAIGRWSSSSRGGIVDPYCSIDILCCGTSHWSIKPAFMLKHKRRAGCKATLRCCCFSCSPQKNRSQQRQRSLQRQMAQKEDAAVPLQSSCGLPPPPAATLGSPV